MASDIYAQVSSRIDTDWYPYHKEEWFTQRDICDFFEWKESETKKSVSKKLYHESKEKQPPFLRKENKAYYIIDDEA